MLKKSAAGAGGTAPEPGPDTGARAGRMRAQRWLARLAFAAAIAAVTVLLVFAGRKSVSAVLLSLAIAAVACAAAWWFVTNRGIIRWLSAAALLACPVAMVVLYALAGLLWVAAASAALAAVAVVAGRAALGPATAASGPLEHQSPRPARPFVIMNPRSGGGKVAQFGLSGQAAALGAEVALLEGPGTVDVAALASQALRRGADLLGVAGGDGTQALVAGIAAEHDVPLMVISAGTRNHFALDLGLDRDNPATCLDALSDGVEIRIDLGLIGDRTFVNNASFGAYAALVRSPAYRDDKVGTALRLLPELLGGEQAVRLAVTVDGRPWPAAPAAVLVSNNPYESGDVTGLGHRARLDRGVLGVIGVYVDTAAQAIGLLRGTHSRGLVVHTAHEVVVDADVARIPVGIDGEAVLMPTPVRCSIRAAALRVRVPRHRPGVRLAKPPMDWARLRRQALTMTRTAGGPR